MSWPSINFMSIGSDGRAIDKNHGIAFQHFDAFEIPSDSTEIKKSNTFDRTIIGKCIIRKKYFDHGSYLDFFICIRWN